MIAVAVPGRARLDRRLCVAPMMEWTDRHCRYLLRLIAPGALLYTEMVVAAAIEHGDVDRLLAFDPRERPLALQLGGSCPQQLAMAAAVGEKFGYDEINLNVGCPSGRVQAGRFGACLMREPQLVADCVTAMREAVSLPVTVKTRIGVDDDDSPEFLLQFAAAVTGAGCDALIVHARKALLEGLSPKENREVPPLNYPVVSWLQQQLDEAVPIIVNGGVRDAQQFGTMVQEFTGVMIGRAAYQSPMVLNKMQRMVDPVAAEITRQQVITAYLPYISAQLERGVRLHSMTRHMLGIYQGQPGARQWRRRLSQAAGSADASAAIVRAAMDSMPQAV
ncbi:MAG: tRNA dihydrouridine(20/20a) synthase DusA [Gammaproteobacteria bacterium]|nr:tRNA dihydrouridine(20/20a) synthase DusA [Gammaproteobacteria bacterium]NNF59876.1 tRNA dihydrouridine(20/20a) synthase DusA [Gammaproteobacteria bacterium]NNM21483.1 tRNA dihydrouridine(20/20a) synthase DusA [Gammaproteobacteria bacterium]